MLKNGLGLERRSAVATKELWEAFQHALPDLLANPENVDKYALIHGGKVDSLYSTKEEGHEAGYEKFGIEPFLVQHVVQKEIPRYCSRSVVPWQE